MHYFIFLHAHELKRHSSKPVTDVILIACITKTIKVDVLSVTLCLLGAGEKFCKWYQNMFFAAAALLVFVDNHQWITCHAVIHFAQIKFFSCGPLQKCQ